MKKWLLIAALFISLCVSIGYVFNHDKSSVKKYQQIQDTFIVDTVNKKFFKIFTINADPYNVDVIVIMSNDTVLALNTARIILEDKDLKIGDFNVAGLTMFNPGYPIVVWLPVIPQSVYEVGTANHELTHVVTTIMLYAGIPLNYTTQEAYAYEMGYLSRQFYAKAYK